MSLRSTSKVLCALALASIAAGCAGNGDEVAEVQAALEQENGGMEMSVEEPGFGDPLVAATPELVADFADTTDMTASMAPSASKYHIMLLWGHLPPAHDADDADVSATPAPIDWSGSVSVDEGAVGVRRTLRFELHDGLSPRTAPNVVDFRSHTLPRMDGLLLEIAVPEGAATALHVSTASLSTDIDLASLAAQGGGVSRLADGKNGLVWLGYQDEPGIHKGFIMGQWGKLQAEVGRLRGRVVGGDGAPLGHVKGIWGHAPNKDKDLFFGKFIDHEGNPRGLFGGEYGEGAFAGKWHTDSPEAQGVMQGRYSDGYVAADHRGVFLGRWSEKAPE